MNESNIVSAAALQKEYEYSAIKQPLRYELFLITKRAFDIVFSTIMLIALSPLFLIISLLIKLDSSGNSIYKHKRIGKEGKTIYLYKFRTMYKNSKELMDKFTKEQKEEFAKNFKLVNDPRITKIGKILRKTSLDELPQLLNILKGDMSLIGPRPVVEKEIEKYGMLKNRFLSVTPGLTGYWACSGRSDIDYDERIKLELYYVYNCCWKLDIKIFFKTIKSVIKKDGAI